MKPTGKAWMIPGLKAAPKGIKPTAYKPPADAIATIAGEVVTVSRGGKSIGTPLRHTTPVEEAWVSRDGRYVVTQFGNVLSYAYLWSLSRGLDDPNTLLFSTEAWLSNVLFSAGNSFLGFEVQYEGYDGPPVSEVYRLQDDEQLRAQVEFFAPLQAVDFSSDGQRAVTRSNVTQRPDVKKPLLRPYLIFYRVDESARRVEVLRFWHGAQDPDRLR